MSDNNLQFDQSEVRQWAENTNKDYLNKTSKQDKKVIIEIGDINSLGTNKTISENKSKKKQ